MKIFLFFVLLIAFVAADQLRGAKTISDEDGWFFGIPHWQSCDQHAHMIGDISEMRFKSQHVESGGVLDFYVKFDVYKAVQSGLVTITTTFDKKTVVAREIHPFGEQQEAGFHWMGFHVPVPNFHHKVVDFRVSAKDQNGVEIGCGDVFLALK
eukprot:TRINITY_DN781837_c0_g1_i1.p1 TRINITY_DN781837_c0_g1~~TRINITY_DN781837_c0_g1_i1.p1  ORF type:complete len:153 (-),score=40.98 TRINITY_DN781837_c0_g1_i1:247-705(-)